MNHLPTLDLAGHAIRLPLAPATADSIACALLDGDETSVVAALGEALSLDPSFTLWEALRSTHRDPTLATLPPCIEELAKSLASEVLRAFDWSNEELASEPRDKPTPSAAGCAALSARAVELGVRARVAATRMPDVAERAFVAGLLSSVRDWLGLAGVSYDALAPSLPAWLVAVNKVSMRSARDVSSHAVALARRTAELMGVRPVMARGSRSTASAASQCATSARKRWTAKPRAIGERLPMLAVRLRRLDELETRFSERLETEKLEAMAEFAAGAGHEINNPLAVISGRAQLFLRHETDPERRHELAVMHVQARRVYDMIADMMLFARPPRPHCGPVDLTALLRMLADELAPKADELGAALVCRVESDCPPLMADGTQIAVALRAVCDNALDAASEQGRVEVLARAAAESSRTPAGVEFVIRDTGPGIAPEVRRHLFDPFYSGRGAGRGLGMGLAKSWRIVANHGGRIDVDSAAESGSVFTIRLPTNGVSPATAPPDRGAAAESRRP